MSDWQDRLGNRSDEAQLRYMRAAEYAQDKRYEDAESEFAAALALNPELHTARFQMGLLQLTCARVGDARATWAALHEPSAPPDLQHFVCGLEALIEDNFPASIQWLQAGITLNQTNAPLNKDMAMMIAHIEATMKANAALATTPTPSATPLAAQDKRSADEVRTDFSLYKKN